MVAASVALPAAGARAVEIPIGVGGLYIQTNGLNSAIGLGDWYAASAAQGGGATSHSLRINVPCSWPAGLPVHVDLFGAPMTSFAAVQGRSEEPTGSLDTSTYTLTGPGGVTHTEVFRPIAGAEAWQRFFTIADGRAGCGEWVLTDALLAVDPLNPGTNSDDQNGWRLRVASDNDADPATPPPASADNPDGLAGTDDEIVVGLDRTTYQHDAGAVTCQTLWAYVDPGLPSIRFHNFDMDGNGRVRYYPPGTPVDASGTSGGVAGTVSANARWNGSAGTTRVGDLVNAPATGWWAIVSCISNHNQLIQEGVSSGPSYLAQPPTPALAVTKSNGTATVVTGSTTSYDVAISNTSNGPTAGAARAVTVTDPLPAGLAFGSCSWQPPASGTCTASGGVVTATLSGALNAGVTATLRVAADVLPAAFPGPVVNTASVSFQDSYGHPFTPVTATDTDAVVRPADVRVRTSLVGPVVSSQPIALLAEVGSEGAVDAAGVVVGGDLPTGFAFSSFEAPPGWSCATDLLAAPPTWSCARAGDFATGAPDEQIRLLGSVTAVPGGVLPFAAAVSTTTPEIDLADNADAVSEPIAGIADVRVTTAFQDSVEAGEPNALLVDLGSEGAVDAAGVVVGGELPNGFAFASFDAPPGWTCSTDAVAVPPTWSCARAGDFATGAPDERIRLLGSVTAAGGSTVDFAAAVTTTTLEIDRADNSDSVSAPVKALALAAVPFCDRDVPKLRVTSTAVGFTPTPLQTATVVWRKATGEVVRTDADVPLAGAVLLWPGAVVDAAGLPLDWPGWDLVNGNWVEVDDGLRPTMTVEVSVNPTASAVVSYPPATPTCAANPPAALSTATGTTPTTTSTTTTSTTSPSATPLASTGADALSYIAAWALLLTLGGATLRVIGR
jgi:uncharacterized repeat protein (TIGR01451 family)